MTRTGWIIFVLPLAIWGIGQAWTSAYQLGYEQGQEQAWHTARAALSPTGPLAQASLVEPTGFAVEDSAASQRASR
jgi:hypothetical protein